jgi:hypothetical protein
MCFAILLAIPTELVAMEVVCEGWVIYIDKK